MKSLRQLLRRPSASNAWSPKRRSGNLARGDVKRRLSTQALEKRQLLAGDVSIGQNLINRYDVNEDLRISPRDALLVINYLAADQAEGEATGRAEGEAVFENRRVDVNGDGNITPGDALQVINAIARGEQMDPLVQFFLTARDENDDPLPVTNGTIEVGTGLENSFFLEVSYEDLRPFGADVGAFTMNLDFLFSRGGLIQPALNESQTLFFGPELASSSTSGDLVIGQVGSAQEVRVSAGTLRSQGADAIRDALTAFGYDAADLDVRSIQGGNDEFPIGFRIRYVGDQYRNDNVPDLTFTDDFGPSVAIATNVVQALNQDGSLNEAALPYSLNDYSRTFNNNPFYVTKIQSGEFDPDQGFFEINPGLGSGAQSNLDEPFDAFSLEVFVTDPIAVNNPLEIQLQPSLGVASQEFVLLYNENDPVPEDLIVTGEMARVTISTGATAVNNPPDLATTPLTFTRTEDDPGEGLDLLTGASDVDGDSLSVSGFQFTAGDLAGVTQDGSTLTVTPSAYNALAVGQSNEITATYNVSDGNGGNTPQTVTLTITGVNDAPDVSGPITETRSENAPSFNIDLLQNASDVDGDTLDAINITQVGSDDASGITVDDVNNFLTVDPAAYAALEDGQSVTVTYSYTVSDGNGGEVPTQVTVTINGDTPNRNPEVSGPVTLTATEDAADTTVNLLDGATDPDTGDVLSVVDFALVSGNDAGVTRNGDALAVSPGAYNSLPEGGQEQIIYDYRVIDQESGTVDQSATITITGVNDAPTIADPVSADLTEDDAATTVDLLTGAEDPDTGDSVSVDGLTLVSGDAKGITVNGDTLSIDPSAYNDLAAGAVETLIYSYNVIDGNNASTPQSATITIAGVNDAPTVGNAIAAQVSEDDAPVTVDLLTGATDPDTSDALSVSNVTTVSGNSAPFQFNNGDGTLSFDPNAYNSLADGEVEEVVLNFDVIDGNGGVAPQSATITINGANDAPVVSGPISVTLSEQDASTTVSLLQNASDADASDTLSITGVNISGDDAGVSQNGSSVLIDPNAYDSLAAGQSAVVTLTYQVTDGEASVDTTATITITGVDDDPVVQGPINLTFDERDTPTSVNLLQGASDPNGDPLNIINPEITSGDSRGVTVDLANSQLLVNPRAYADLEDGQSATVVVEYDISDDEGHTTSQTATIVITGRTIIGSSISGELFIDYIENPDGVREGDAPIRNGEKDDDEQALGGVTVRLMRVTPEGETEVARVMTDNDGQYTFEEVLGGTYFVEYEVPSSVRYTGAARGMVVVDELGGESLTGPSLDAIGLAGIQQRLDLLAKSYIAQGIIDTSLLTNGLAGGSAQFNGDGTQSMFIAGDGFDTEGVGLDAEYAEIVLNEARDAALLTVMDSNGGLHSARLTLDQFVVAGDGEGVRFFGRLEDLNFGETPQDAIESEFVQYRNAIDRVMAAGV